MRVHEAVWIGIIACVIAYGWWRIWQWKTRFRWSRALLVPSNQLSWQAPTSDLRERSAKDGRKRTSPVRARSKPRSGDDIEMPSSALSGFVAATTLAGIDSGTLHTIEIATIEQLRGVNSINDYVKAHFRDVAAASAQTWMQRLEDYVAEHQAAVTLEKAGHDVRLSASPAGWSWLVDGQPIEVKKGTGSLAAAKAALAHLHSAAKQKGEMVNGLSDFDHDAIATASKDALSVVHEGFDAGLHIPLGTLLRSGWRELELLFDKKTPIERAVKHVAMDVASVGTGAFLGAKVGGGLGAVAGPLGVGAGVLVGAMAGAIAGRGLAHKSRMAPFTKAYERYEATLGSARSGVETALAESKAEVLELESLYQTKFESARNEIESAARNELGQLERKQTESLKQFLQHFPNYLGAIEAQLVQDEAAVLSEMPRTHWWNWIFPRRQDLEKSITRRWFKCSRKIVKKERRRFEKLKDASMPTLQSKVQRFLGAYTFALKSFDEDLGSLANEFGEARSAAETIRHAALCGLENVRDQMLGDFRNRVAKMYFVLGQAISSWREKVEVSLDELRKQATPLGIELPE